MTKRGKQKQNIAQKTRSEQWCSQHKIFGGTNVWTLSEQQYSILQRDKCVLLWRLILLFSRYFAHLFK